MAAGRPEPGCDASRQRALALLEAARDAARAQGRSDVQIESARFAMVAWIDEILARHPGCPAGTAPLQQALFASSNAKTEFFHHLSALRPDDDEVREVYWRAMELGFKGQYYFESGDDGELAKLRALHGGQLALGAASAAGLRERLTAPLDLGTEPAGLRDPARHRSSWLQRLGLALVLVAVLGGALWWFLPAGPRATSSTLAERVDAQLQSHACADLSASVTPDGAARVRGYVPLPEEKEKVQRDVLAVPGVTAAVFDLQVRIWPHCEVLALLKPYQARNREDALGLAIATPTAHDGRLREGDQVLIQVTNPRREGYLRVDYYTADGAVMHLNTPLQRLRAGETLEIGRDIPSSWLAAPPFGTVLVTALSSPTPFGESAERPPFELASAYLQRLREALATSPSGGQVVAEVVFLETVPR